jgi:UV DNA damage endonuclease
MRLGFAVKVLGRGGLPSHDTRRWQSGPHLRVSLERLRAILAYLDEEDIRMYRFSSSLAPYASHPELSQFHGQLGECAEELGVAGDLARELGIRLSSHPGQYSVLNSEREDVRTAALAELEVQAGLLDRMGAGPEAVVVFHVGGLAGGRDAATERFERALERASASARARLVIENDDRSFGVAPAVDLARRAGLRVVFDVHHHLCHDLDGIPDAEALRMCLATWPRDQVPKVHFSSPRLEITERRRRVGRRIERTPVITDPRRHADLIDPLAFEYFLRHTADGAREFDVMLEAKGKDLALLRLREQLAARGVEPWASRPPA